MKPTYSTGEVRRIIGNSKTRGDLDRICDLINEEKRRYTLYDLRLLQWWVSLKSFYIDIIDL